MDDSLVLTPNFLQVYFKERSRTISAKSEWSIGSDVLILIVVDDGLVLTTIQLSLATTLSKSLL